MKYSGVMGGIHTVSEWIMRFSVINLLWIIINIPIIFILAAMLFARNQEDLLTLLPLLIVLLPFLFFPTTQALFASVREWVMQKEHNGLIRSYWCHYRENYKKNFIGGSFLTFLWLIWGVDFFYFSIENELLMYVFCILGILLYVYTVNYLSINAHYNIKLRKVFKMSLLLTVGSPILFLTVLVTNGIILVISITEMQFLIPFFTGTSIAYLSFFAFYRFYLQSCG